MSDQESNNKKLERMGIDLPKRKESGKHHPRETFTLTFSSDPITSNSTYYRIIYPWQLFTYSDNSSSSWSSTGDHHG